MAKHDIFLCYRRSDTQAETSALQAKLDLEFGADTRFQDTSSVRAGEDWRTVIKAAIGRAKVVLVVIGAGWLAPKPGKQTPRIHLQDDDVRFEIEVALGRHGGDQRPVLIPVLFDTEQPDADELPESIVSLFAHNCVRIALDTIGRDTRQLVADIAAKDRGLTARESSASTATPRSTQPEADRSAEYRTWARAQHGRLRQIGVAGGDLTLGFDQIYVPLRVSPRDLLDGARPRRELLMGPDDAEFEHGSDGMHAIELLELLRRSPTGHAAILGEPGTGKTTALRKLLHHCNDDDPGVLGLPADTQAFFVRLRHLQRDDLAEAFEQFLERDLDDQCGKQGFGAHARQIWERGSCLVLLDGLDEIADDELRADALDFLDRTFRAVRTRAVHAVLTSRNSALGDEVRIPPEFLKVDIRALDPAQIESIVRKWFDAACSTLKPHDPQQASADAQADSDSLLTELESGPMQSLRVIDLVSTPLFLTLLCVVKLRGGTTPTSRADFFHRCLDVSLSSWPKNERRTAPLLTVEEFLAILRPIAWDLHRQRRRDGVSDLEFAASIQTYAERVLRDDRPGGRPDPLALFRWLWRDAGVLDEFGNQSYGFAHLGIQEYLAARHIANGTADAIESVASDFPDAWWREVALLAVSFPEHAVASALFAAILAKDGWRDDPDHLLTAMIGEARHLDATPFVARLKQSRSIPDRARLLRWLNRLHDEGLVDFAERHRTASNELGHAARSYLERFAPERTPTEADARESICVVNVTADLATVDHFLADLTTAGVSVAATADIASFAKSPGVDAADTTVLLFGESTPAGESQLRMADALWSLLESNGGTPIAVDVRRDRVSALPVRAAERVVGWQPGSDAQLLRRALGMADASRSTAPQCVAPTRLARAEPGGIAWVTIPGGTFSMGAPDLPWASPVHDVRVHAFALARTPVTNEQYRRFVEATSHPAPAAWRERRFKLPDQPVVTVSWEDAQEFCRWHSATSGIKTRLPTEAEWEYACRAGTTTGFWFGPDTTKLGDHAWFADNSDGQPRPVGLKPTNPFGLCDMHGNVWEWCQDRWHENYEGARDDGGAWEAGSSPSRVLRGGSWRDTARYCRSAYRGWRRPGGRLDYLGLRPARFVTE